MSIRTFTCYTLICDGCGRDLCANDEVAGYAQLDIVEGDIAADSDWLIADDGNHYCSDCWKYDGDENKVPVAQGNA